MPSNSESNPADSPAPAQPPSRSPAATLWSGKTHTGKVARLPKALREQINQLLDDGLSYAQVISALGQPGQLLQPHHIRRWKSGGYQDHLRHLRFLDQCHARSDRALDLFSQTGHLHGFQAIQQLAAAQIAEALLTAGDSLRQALADNPTNYFRMLNAFCRIAAGALNCEHLLADHPTPPANPSATEPGLSPELRRRLEKELNLM